MSGSIDKGTSLEIFKKGIANNEFFSKKSEGVGLLKNILKIFRLLTYRLISGRKHKLSSDSVLLVWIPLHEKILNSLPGEKVVLLDHKNTLTGYSFLSYIPLFHVVRTLFHVPINVRKDGLLCEWCFFNALTLFFNENVINSVSIAGHYDKYATWVSYLAKEMGIHMTISQHGANCKHNLPNKIPADRVEVFSKAEEDMFRTTILNPDETEFNIKGFKSSLTFTQGDFKNRTVAIASQPGYEDRVIKLIEIIKSVDKRINVIVYSHPTDRFRKGECALNNYANCQLEHYARYWDVDFLIVFTSTLAYDYWSCEKFAGNVLCYYDEECIVALYNDERGTVIYPETCYQQLKDILV